jgi:hypothetical protein
MIAEEECPNNDIKTKIGMVQTSIQETEDRIETFKTNYDVNMNESNLFA